jgi:hypothetical protein
VATMVNHEQWTTRPGKKHAAAELAERHDVRASSVPEREWKRLFMPTPGSSGNPRTCGEVLRLLRLYFSNGQWCEPESDGPPGS